jgi:hypothetical protein
VGLARGVRSVCGEFHVRGLEAHGETGGGGLGLGSGGHTGQGEPGSGLARDPGGSVRLSPSPRPPRLPVTVRARLTSLTP